MNRVFVFLIALMGLGISSCSDDRVFEEFKALPTQNWAMEDSLHFDLSAVQLQDNQSLIAFRFNEEYAFSNCYVRVLSQDSTGTIIENKLINVPLFDSKTGEPLGDGFGSTYTFYDSLPFQLPNHTKKVTLLQYMRQNQLPGIEAVGLKILQ
ncbi:gliding motility lipoprotein GldH [Algoriphagus halophilus]|nr:gliding motility lipoprotein GldH [Algoriphagus halophilus]